MPCHKLTQIVVRQDCEKMAYRIVPDIVAVIKTRSAVNFEIFITVATGQGHNPVASSCAGLQIAKGLFLLLNVTVYVPSGFLSATAANEANK